MKVVSSNFRPDTGLSVTLFTDEDPAVFVGTANESPSGSGQYSVTFTSVEQWGFWYVGGVQKPEWGQVWLGTEGGSTATLQSQINSLQALVLQRVQFGTALTVPAEGTEIELVSPFSSAQEYDVGIISAVNGDGEDVGAVASKTDGEKFTVIPNDAPATVKWFVVGYQE
jgi:hypothetical protein